MSKAAILARRLTRPTLLIIIVSGLSLVIIALLFATRMTTEAANYETTVASRGDVEQTIIASGTLRATRTVEVGSEVSGQVEAVLVEVNSRVRAGQALAQIELTRLNAALRQSEATIGVARASLAESEATIAREELGLEDARRSLGRVQRLAGQGLVSQAALDNALTAVRRAEISVRAAHAARSARSADLSGAQARRDDAVTSRERATIVSPIDGVILSRQIDPGQTLVSSFQTPRLFEIAADLSDMRLEVAVNEADIGQIATGQSVRFSVDAFPDRTFSGRVLQIDPQASTADNVITFQVLVSVDNSDGSLRPGMSTTAEIVTGAATGVLRVPIGATTYRPPTRDDNIVSMGRISVRPSPRLTGGQPTPHRRVTRVVQGDSQGGTFVWRLDPDTDQLVRVPVTFGIRGDSWVQIIGGDLKAGDTVVIGQGTNR